MAAIKTNFLMGLFFMGLFSLSAGPDLPSPIQVLQKR
jgi:hypothetical protein